MSPGCAYRATICDSARRLSGLDVLTPVVAGINAAIRSSGPAASGSHARGSARGVMATARRASQLSVQAMRMANAGAQNSTYRVSQTGSAIEMVSRRAGGASSHGTATAAGPRISRPRARASSTTAPAMTRAVIGPVHRMEPMPLSKYTMKLGHHACCVGSQPSAARSLYARMATGTRMTVPIAAAVSQRSQMSRVPPQPRCPWFPCSASSQEALLADRASWEEAEQAAGAEGTRRPAPGRWPVPGRRPAPGRRAVLSRDRPCATMRRRPKRLSSPVRAIATP